MEHEGGEYANRDCYFWYSNKKIIKRTGRLGSLRTSGVHPNYNSVENSHNTEKIPGDLRRLAVNQTPVKDHQITLM